MNGLVTTAGLYDAAFGIFHLFFWRIFHWREDLENLSSVNRSIMQVLNLCLIFLFFVMAYACLFQSQEMLSTGLGRTLMVSLSLFWFLRAIEQVIFFGTKNAVSLGFILVFLAGCVLHLLPLF
jgi:hypothetical protein